MNDTTIRDVRILESQALLSPDEMAEQYPVTEAAANTVMMGREEVQRILRREDDRFLVIVGPCSIHDVDSAIEYATRLAELRKKYADRMCIVMRVYFEKPRTTVGWRGLIMDPGLDQTSDIPRGSAGTRNSRQGKRARPSLRFRNARSHRSPVYVRPCELGVHRRADDRKPDAP